MNLDRFFIFLVLALLPMLWLPAEWLGLAVIFLLIFTLFSLINALLFKQNWQWFWLFFLLTISYGRIGNIAKNAENQTARKVLETIQIQKLLKQGEYQTAIAERENGEWIYLNWQTKTPLVLEQRYQAELNLRPISARLNIGNFDRQRWYSANHINGLATVKKASEVGNYQPSFRTMWLNRSREQTQNLATQGILLALAFGERAWLENQHWQIFQQTATAHLIAISGLHIGLAYWFGLWLAKFGLYPFSRFLGSHLILYCPRLVGFGLALGYSYLAGFAVPTLRALLAISVVLACQFARRHYTPLQFWWRVVAMLLVLDPVSVLSDSLWLSVLAVLSLILWYRYFPLTHFSPLLPLGILLYFKRKNLSQFARLSRAFLAKFLVPLVHLQLGILLIFAPVQFFFFEGTSPFAFLANLLIVPLYSIVLTPLILFTLLTDNLLQTWLWADWLTQFSVWLIEPFSHFWLALSQWWQWQIITFNLLILLLIYGLITVHSKRFWLGASLFLLTFNGAFYGYQWQQPKTQWLTFDVGQGLAQALIYQAENDVWQKVSGQKKAIFYDTGNSWGEHYEKKAIEQKEVINQQNSMARLEILPYLKRHGIEVEAIFLSHDDNDHSGGVSDLLQAFPHARLISASEKAYFGKSPEPCLAGQHWQFGVFHLTAIYPEQRVARAKNHHSCIILVEFDRLRLLLTGDSGREQERLWTAKAGRVDWLQVPHHGSKSSSSFSLLATAKPRLAVVSAGRWNPWKLPNKQILERYQQQGISVLNTATEGMVRINVENGKAEIETARGAFSAWYRQFYP